MTFGKWARRMAGMALVSLVGTACKNDGTSTSVTVVAKPFGLNESQLSTVIDKAAVEGSLPSTRWVAVMHAEAMQEVMARGAALRAASPVARCQAVARIVRNQVPAMQRNSLLSDAAIESIISRSLQRGGCAVATQGSIFGSAAGLLSLGRATEEYTTGDFMLYVPALQDAYNTEQSPEGVESRVATILASATSLPAPDYEVLSAIGSMTVSDAYYWHTVQASGGCGACGGDDPPQYAMSLFGAVPASAATATMGQCGFWCRTGWSDLVGGVGAVAATAQVTGGAVVIVPQTAAIAFGAGSITASALYAISAM